MSKTIYTEGHKKLTRKLKLARLSAGLNQKTAAKLLNTSQSYISKMESGQRKVDLIQLMQIAKMYKIKIEYFI